MSLEKQLLVNVLLLMGLHSDVVISKSSISVDDPLTRLVDHDG